MRVVFGIILIMMKMVFLMVTIIGKDLLMKTEMVSTMWVLIWEVIYLLTRNNMVHVVLVVSPGHLMLQMIQKVTMKVGAKWKLQKRGRNVHSQAQPIHL